MDWQLPKALQPGDEVAVVLPSSAVRDLAPFEHGLERLREWQLRPHVLCKGAVDAGVEWPEGCTVAAPDADRLAAFQQAITEPRFRAVFCGRGGYGAARLLPDLDWEPLREDPKPIVGYSDITALLAGARVGAGILSFHGPMVATTPAMDPSPAGWELQRGLLTRSDQATPLPPAPAARVLSVGTATGRLVGGNLAVLQGLIGTPWEIGRDGDDVLLFLEDIGEAPYRVDRMLTQLRQTALFERVAGVVLGDFHVDETELASEHPPMTAVLADRLGDLDVPVAMGFPFGHRPGSWTLPFGGRARLVAGAAGGPATLELLDPAVR